MDHLLDHSKINYYGRPRSSSQVGQNDNQRIGSNAGRTPHLGSSITLEADTSLAALTEEVVDTAFYSFCCSLSQQTILDHKVAVILDIDQAGGVNWDCRIPLGAWKRVVINLVGNALKYTKSGYIHVSLAWKKSKAVFIIKDSGCGMSKAFLNDRLFRAFAQEDTFADGTGLGLNLVHTILKAIGGSIEVESEQNVGTTVTTTIPLRRPPLGSHSAPSTEDADLPKLPEGFTVAIPSPTADPTSGPGASQTSRAIPNNLLVGSIIKACSENGIKTTPWNSMSSKDADVEFLTAEQVRRLLDSSSDADRAGASPSSQKVRVSCAETR